MLFQTNKPKSAAKIMIPPSQELDDLVLSTLEWIALMAGVTLGPGGKQALIERPEMGMKPFMTKDGVTVVKNLGFRSATKQLILEAARDAAIRTASEAGDGTTTATILSASIAKQTASAVRASKMLSPQLIVREMQSLVPVIEAFVKQHVVKVTEENYDEILYHVARLSANGDKALAKKVVAALDLVGDEGNLTIVEKQGESKIDVERIKGYSLESGYEIACRTFGNGFPNDKSGTLVVLDSPAIVLYDGVITDTSQIFEFLNKTAHHFAQNKQNRRGLVFVSHGFADSVLGDLHVNWNDLKSPIQVFPVVTPDKAVMNWRSHLLHDLAAYTGGTVFNPIDRPIVDADVAAIARDSRLTYFECGRFNTNLMAKEDQSAIDMRVEELKAGLKSPESELEANDLQVRIGKLTSGIARMTISGPSGIETRERRDRADDAWMAIRGTLRHGAVPGGGYVLVKLSAQLMILADQLTASDTGKIALNILANALLRPVEVLYENYGYQKEQIEQQRIRLLKCDDKTFDIMQQKWVDKELLLDSAPAVIEAIRNSISIASLFGTVGGIIAFERDGESDKAEEDFVRRFQSAIGERSYE